MKIQVIDNVLDDEQCEYLRSIALGSEIPWYYVPNIAVHDKNAESSELHSGYSHNCIDEDFKIVSSYAFTFLPILFESCKSKQYNVSEVLRVRLFSHPAKPTANIPNDAHNDLPYHHMVCLYYFNDSDGDTIFYDDNGKEVFRNTPKKNTAVIFDGSIKHCSSTSSMRRTVINFNFTVAI